MYTHAPAPATSANLSRPCKRRVLTRKAVVASLALAILAGERAAAVPGIYDFENLSLGTLDGHDNWQPANGNPGIWTVELGTGVDTTKVIRSSDTSRGTWLQRWNNADFRWATFSSNETAGVFQFDTRVTTQIGNLAQFWPMLINNLTAYGPSFAISNNKFSLGQAAWGQSVLCNTPASIHDGDWIRLRMVVNFQTNNYEGTSVLLVRNLTAGETNFTQYLAQTNLHIQTNLRAAGLSDPRSWTGVLMRTD